MSLLLKMLRNVDKTQMENLGFSFKKNRFYRLYNRSFQTIEFQPSRIDYDNFQVFIGMSFLSKIIRHHEGGYTFYEFTGENYQQSYGYADEFYFDRESQENTNIVFSKIFDQIEKRVVPLLNQITDERSFLEMGERTAGDNHTFFYTNRRDCFLYAFCERFDEAIEILSKLIECNKVGAEQNYQYFIRRKMPERAEEVLQNQLYFMQESQITMDALKNHDNAILKEIVKLNKKDNIEYLWKNYRIRIPEVDTRPQNEDK